MEITHNLGAPLVVVLLGSMIASITDLTNFKVYNVLTIPLMVSGILYNGWAGGLDGLAKSGLGLLFGFGILLAFFVAGGVGAGDVKLMAAVGSWLGMPQIFYVFFASAMAAGVYAVVLMSVGRNLRETWDNIQLLWFRLTILGRYLGSSDRIEVEVHRPDRRRRLIPFAAMTMVGIFALIVSGWIGPGH